MTIEERFARIEHVTAGLAEERRKDREENRQIWRNTQQNLDALTVKIAALAEENRAMAAENRAAFAHLTEVQAQDRIETREWERRLDDRIDKLVSAMGEYIRRNPTKT